jgi:hypothetical protein
MCQCKAFKSWLCFKGKWTHFFLDPFFPHLSIGLVTMLSKIKPSKTIDDRIVTLWHSLVVTLLSIYASPFWWAWFVVVVWMPFLGLTGSILHTLLVSLIVCSQWKMLATKDTEYSLTSSDLPSTIWASMVAICYAFPSPTQGGIDPLDAGNPGVQEFNRTIEQQQSFRVTIDEQYLHNLS